MSGISIMTEDGWKEITGFPVRIKKEAKKKADNVAKARRMVAHAMNLPNVTEDDRTARHFAIMQGYAKLSKAHDAVIGG